MRWLAVLLTAIGLGAPAALAEGAAGATTASQRPHMTLSASGVNGTVGAIISGSTWQVHGVVYAYVPHQRVALHVFRNGVEVFKRSFDVRRQGHRDGVFDATVSVGGIGRLTVHAIHYATAAQPAFVAPAFSLWEVAPSVQPGQSSYAARILQYQLSAHHFVVGAPGVYDAQTQWAVMAFRKMAGLDRTFVADATVFDALAAGEGAFVVRYPSQGRHVEADLTHQVIALIGANEVVQRIYAISSGKPSTPTELGNFAVYTQTPGINDKGMVDSSYFNGGDAIHGYDEVPAYAASHGCLRVWIPDALSIYDWVRIGTPVDVYYR